MKIKSQKGSITIFVLIALLFYTAFLILMYAASSNKLVAIKEKSDILKGIYEKNTSEESINNFFKKKTAQYNEEIENRKLPSEYQKVEYIESSGTQWIDTKFLPQSNIKYKYSADFKLEDFSKEKQTIMGNDTCDIRIDKNGYINGQISQPYIGINRHSIVIEVQKSQNGNHRFICSCDGLVYASSEYTYWVNKNISIFTNLTYNNRISKAKIFSANIFNNDNIVRDFIPCYRKSDNKPGLYDLVENKFYTNQGTGEFVAGPDVD